MKTRVLAAVVAAALAATALAGCRTNVGTAAKVNGHSISDSQVSDYLAPAGPASSVVADARANNQTISAPRSQVLNYLVLEQVFEQTLRKNGGVPSPGELASYHDKAASLLLQTDLAGAELDRQLNKGLAGVGVSPKLTNVFLRVQELEYALIQRKQLGQLSDLVALVKKSGVRVTVSPRYGTWDESQLSLNPAVVTPGYLSVQPSQPAAG